MDQETLELRATLLQKYRDDKKKWVNTPSYKLILEEVGVPMAQPSGFRMLVKIFGAADKIVARKSPILLPDSAKLKDLYNSRVGLVLAMGPEAYDPKRFPYAPYCDIGEYIMFTRHDSALFQVNGHNLSYLLDDKCFTPVLDPSSVTYDLQIGI